MIMERIRCNHLIADGRKISCQFPTAHPHCPKGCIFFSCNPYHCFAGSIAPLLQMRRIKLLPGILLSTARKQGILLLALGLCIHSLMASGLKWGPTFVKVIVTGSHVRLPPSGWKIALIYKNLLLCYSLL
jgi:hypothetical protein